jgi:hypothetical protein
MIMQVTVSSANDGLKLKSSLVKNATDVLRFLTGGFTGILILVSFPIKSKLKHAVSRSMV